MMIPFPLPDDVIFEIGDPDGRPNEMPSLDDLGGSDDRKDDDE